MNRIEEQIHSNEAYLPELTRRDDFADFWSETREKADAVPLDARREPGEYPLPHMRVYRIRYAGFEGTPIHGWFLTPDFTGGRVPCVVHYHGFGGDAGRPADYVPGVMLGCAVRAGDCRDQSGATGDSRAWEGGSCFGLMSRGILNRNDYYLRAQYMDCVRALDFACAQPEVDCSRIVVEGGSQGGALCMAVCGLDARPWLALADVPSNSNLEARVEGENGSFSQVTAYLKKYPGHLARAYETLSYFDTMNLADRIACPVYASVALRDNVCPARMYYATFNRIPGPKHIDVYPFNGHEGGGGAHFEKKLRYLKDELERARR